MFELLASTLHGENWLLARLSVDYLARHDAVSPVLHYWAMGRRSRHRQRAGVL